MSNAMQSRLILDRKLIEEKEYWEKALAEVTISQGFITDFERPKEFLKQTDSLDFEIAGGLYEKLRALTGNGAFLIHTTLMAALKVCIYKYTNSRWVVVGTPSRSREPGGDEPPNLVAIVNKIEDDLTFRQLLLDVRKSLLEAYENQNYPFERLVSDLGIKQANNRCALFDVVLASDGIHAEIPEAKNDLTIRLSPMADRLSAIVTFRKSVLSPDTIKVFINHLMNVLKEALDEPGEKVSGLRLIGEEEERRIAYDWNDTAMELPVGRCAHELFERQAERTPGRVAAKHGSREVSYEELESQANQMAHYLKGKGAGRGSKVGVMMGHGVETLVSILGVLKAGAAYVPMEAGYPRQRLAHQVKDSGMELLVTRSEVSGRVEADVERVVVDECWGEVSVQATTRPCNGVGADDLAYVMYTSGSTGAAKGVKVRHGSLSNYISWARSVYVGDEGDGEGEGEVKGEVESFGLYTSLGFDLTVTSIYVPLISGGRVVIYDNPRKEEALEEMVRGGEVTVVKATPSHLKVIRGMDNRGSRVRRLIVGGEALTSELAGEVASSFGGGVEILNEYGPTEATVGCMLYRYGSEDRRRERVAIGRPGGNVRVYVTDGGGRVCGEMEEGEISIGGACLAEGYLNDEVRTAEKFEADPYVGGGRVYRSGDRGRMRPDGEVEYLGRRDEQVKYHGHRVEMEEVRRAINEHKEVRDSVAVVRKDARGEEVMIGYYVSRREIGVEELRRHLRERLIEETIPNLYVRMGRMPLTVNGKVNYEGLPEVEEVRAEVKVGGEGPRSEGEEILVGIWKEVLGLERVGIFDNFFELGGHSLMATQVISRVRLHFGVDISLRDIFAFPTIDRFAKVVESALLAKAGSGSIDDLLDKLDELNEDEVERLLAGNEQPF